MDKTNRRGFLKYVGLAGMGTMLLDTPGLFAETLTATPEQTEGPYYPATLPLDTDNDLLVINNNITPAAGQITYLSGRILSASGEPVRNATMEIWQADNSGGRFTFSARRRTRMHLWKDNVDIGVTGPYGETDGELEKKHSISSFSM